MSVDSRAMRHSVVGIDSVQHFVLTAKFLFQQISDEGNSSRPTDEKLKWKVDDWNKCQHFSIRIVIGFYFNKFKIIENGSMK